MKKPTFDDDVPMPTGHEGRPVKYWWLADLKVGQSFLTELKTARYIQSNTYKKLKYLPDGYKIMTAQEGKQIRVWRTA